MEIQLGDLIIFTNQFLKIKEAVVMDVTVIDNKYSESIYYRVIDKDGGEEWVHTKQVFANKHKDESFEIIKSITDLQN